MVTPAVLRLDTDEKVVLEAPGLSAPTEANILVQDFPQKRKVLFQVRKQLNPAEGMMAIATVKVCPHPVSPNPNPNPNPIHSMVLCSQDCTQTLRKWGGNNPALFAGPTIWDIRAVYPWDGGVFLLRDPHGTILAHKKHLFLHTKHRSGVGVGHSPSNKIRLCAGSGGVCRGYILKSHFYINKTPKTFLFRAKNEAWGFPGQ